MSGASVIMMNNIFTYMFFKFISEKCSFMFFFPYAIYICSCSFSIMKKFSGTKKRQKDILDLCFDTKETRDFRNSVLDVTHPFVPKSLEILFVSLFFLVQKLFVITFKFREFPGSPASCGFPHAFTAKGPASIPSWGTKIPQAARIIQKKQPRAVVISGLNWRRPSFKFMMLMFVEGFVLLGCWNRGPQFLAAFTRGRRSVPCHGCLSTGDFTHGSLLPENGAR